MAKHSSHPGPRAKGVSPEPQGEGYSYEVDKYWVVADTGADGKIVLRTRRGKQRLVEASNPRLRHARWWERFLLRVRFPSLESEPGAA